MSTRFPPPSGYKPRDRSPQRFSDRRPPLGPRGSDDGGGPPIAREPPRGPKALIDHPPRGGSFGARGRGYARSDFRDRDRERDRDRGFRDVPPYRRDVDRDWGRRDWDFEPRDRVNFGRGRSRSPPPRDFHDARDAGSRDPDLLRLRRNSRESLGSTSSATPDGPPSGVGQHPWTGHIRGRGRGDRDGGRGRGRILYHDDRDGLRRRSRSRDEWRDRERERDRDGDRERDWERDRDRDRGLDRRDRFDRREDRIERDDRDPPSTEIWRKERPNSRTETRAAVASGPNAMPIASTGPGTVDRLTETAGAQQMRRNSIVSTASFSEVRRDPERPEHPHSPSLRPTLPKEILPITNSPPPSAPQVPAFGSISVPIRTSHTETSLEGNLRYPPSEKSKNETPSRVLMQPPTGPKAERGEQQPPDAHGVRQGSDSWNKQEPTSRKYQTGPSSTISIAATSLSPPIGPAAMTGKDLPATQADAPVINKSGNIVSPEFGRIRAPSLSPPRLPFGSIPTGPRNFHQPRVPMGRGSPKASHQRVRPGYSRQQSVPAAGPVSRRESLDVLERRMSVIPEMKRRSRAPDEKLTEEVAVSTKEVSEDRFFKDGISKPVAIPNEPSPVALEPKPVVDKMAQFPDQPSADESGALIPDFAQLSDEEDEKIVFTQDYLEERKRLFEKDMQSLKAEMPPRPLEDQTIVSLLLRIQLLGMIANEVSDEIVSEPAVSEANGAAKKKALDHLSMKIDENKKGFDTMLLEGVSAEQITVDSLPFLNTGPPTPLSDLEVCQENTRNHERLKETLRAELSNRRKDVTRKNAALREEYMSYYRPWRMDVWALDREKQKSATPAPVTPPATNTVPPPAPAPEGRRFKGNSELDFQMALRASEISAQEELERRRVKMATARPDLAREAIIPDMLEPHEQKASVYENFNNIVDPALALDVFGFLPPKNDFTPEEHETFTEAFMNYPKKWGKIAESLPGRDFKQCIVHYYSTKEEIKYKAKLNKRWTKRGRARRNARPKSNALMADLGAVKPDYEADDEPLAVTDTGRPRRAAAPTFGDSNAADSDQAVTGRRGNALKDSDQVEKPAARGGRRGGQGARGGRRKVAQQQQPPQNELGQLLLQPQEPNEQKRGLPLQTQALRLTSVPSNSEVDVMSRGTTETLALKSKEQVDKEPLDTLQRAKSWKGRLKEAIYALESNQSESTPPQRQAEGLPQPSSYWSVPEVRDFPVLLGHFGKDFEAISNFMKTKTTVMVKNYFQRRIDSGQKDFEDIAAEAEAKKARGEPTGPLPVPSVVPKRRYEATLSAIAPRPLAPSVEASDGNDAVQVGKVRSVAPLPQQGTMPARAPSDTISSRYPILAQAASTPMGPVSRPSEEPARLSRAQPPTIPPRIQQGPFFTPEERQGPTMPLLTHSTHRPHEIQLQTRQASISSAEVSRVEQVHAPQTILSFTMPVDARGSPLLGHQSVLSGATSAQQQYMQPQQQSQQSPLLPVSHSRHSSLMKPPKSPVRTLQKAEPDSSPIRAPLSETIAAKLYCASSGQHVFADPLLGLLSSREAPRPSSTPAQPAEGSRQIPAKRSNIMSILNDEPEEPQPRKRFANDQALSAIMNAASPLSRPVLVSTQSTPAQIHPPRIEEPSASQQRTISYGQQSQYLPQPQPLLHNRSYSDHNVQPQAQGPSGPPANSDWMSRFDPRGQQQQPQPMSQNQQSQHTGFSSNLGSVTPVPQSAYSSYNPSRTQQPAAHSLISAPSPAPTPPPGSSQRPSYQALYSQPSASHAPSAAGGPSLGNGTRDVTENSPHYRQAVLSPSTRSSSLPYSSRQESSTPNLSSANILNLSSRPPAGTGLYSSSPHLSSQNPLNGHHTYQQHVQNMVNGAHQHHGAQAHLPSLELGGSSSIQSSHHALSGSSQSLSLGRSYTPPLLHPQPSASVSVGDHGYGINASATLQPLHPRHPAGGSLSEASSAAYGHNRVYSDGSNDAAQPH